MSQVAMTVAQARAVAAAFEGGVCGGLLELDMTGIEITSRPFVLLAGALGAGCPSLTTLRLSRCRVGTTGAQALATCIREGRARGLMTLDLSFCCVNDISALAAVVEEGACAQLQELIISHNRLDEPSALALLNALGAGRCPNLTTLGLADVNLTSAAATVLAEGIRKSAFTHLRRLDVSQNWAFGQAGLMAVTSALEQGTVSSR
jgi:Ran GTPase-activating protein (RanGAP) involved in mRNA processing and transport